MEPCDPLTGIPLRASFVESLRASIKNANKQGLKLAVMHIGVDDLKKVNYTYGRHIGDMFLKKAARKIQTFSRREDILCRLGGDEFALLITDFPKAENIDEIAQRILGLFSQPANICGIKLYNTISIGISIYPDDDKDGKKLLEKADIAIYKAKKNGKNNIQYYSEAISNDVHLHNNIKENLKSAFEKNEFFLCYQPLIDSNTKKMVGVEALLRWRHPKNGIINPLDFIPIAEKTLLIIPIGEWVLKEACRQLKEWHEKGYTGYSISVNVSVVQLQQSSFKETVSNILNEVGLKPEYLEIEITESAFIESTKAITCNLNYLSRLGIKIAIDDFGTGYNSFKYLSRLVIDCLKIDKMFVSNIKTNMNKVIIDTVIALGHRINAKIVAEGVETQEQYEYLLKNGCDKIQGYYFSKPVLAEEIVDFFE